jgi:hypothetical protein
MVEKTLMKTIIAAFTLFLLINFCNAQAGDRIVFYPDARSSNCTPYVDVPFKINNFKDIISMQGTISWDSSKLNFSQIVNFNTNIPNWGIGNFGLSAAGIGHLAFLWTDNNLEGFSLDDSSELMIIRFGIKAKDNSIALVSPGNTLIPLEFVNKDLMELSVETDSALVTISKLIKDYNPFPTEIITTEGSIELDAGANYLSYNWSNGDTSRTTKINKNGKYSVIVTNNIYCTGSRNTVVNVGPRPDTIRSLTDGFWNDPDTWVDGFLPVSGSDVLIKNKITINEDRECTSLTLGPGSQIQLIPGRRLTILKP